MLNVLRLLAFIVLRTPSCPETSIIDSSFQLSWLVHKCHTRTSTISFVVLLFKNVKPATSPEKLLCKLAFPTRSGSSFYCSSFCLFVYLVLLKCDGGSRRSVFFFFLLQGMIRRNPSIRTKTLEIEVQKRPVSDPLPHRYPCLYFLQRCNDDRNGYACYWKCESSHSRWC